MTHLLVWVDLPTTYTGAFSSQIGFQQLKLSVSCICTMYRIMFLFSNLPDIEAMYISKKDMMCNTYDAH